MLGSNVIHLRLVNSDEVLGELEKVENDIIYLKRPMIVDEHEDPRTRNVNIVLTKYILFNTSESIPFKAEHVITKSNVLPEISDFYFNSIEYNEKYLEPTIVKDIQKTNEMIRQLLDFADEVEVLQRPDLSLNDAISEVLSEDHIEDDEEPKGQIKIIMLPTSNTIH